MLKSIAENTTHPDFKIFRFGNGIKLSSPDAAHHDPFMHDTRQTINSMFSSSFNVYFYNLESAIQNVNEKNMALFNSTSVKDFIGKTLLDFISKDKAQLVMNNDQNVIKSKKTFINDEYFEQNEMIHSYISIKAPWYSANNKIMGVFGCSIEVNQPDFAESLSFISELGLLNATKSSFIQTINNINFTIREIDILRFMIRGKTAKQIATILQLSRRTVEHHIENVKNKMGVNTKSEIIDRLIDYLLF